MFKGLFHQVASSLQAINSSEFLEAPLYIGAPRKQEQYGCIVEQRDLQQGNLNGHMALC